MPEIALRAVEDHETDHFWELLQEYLGEDAGRSFTVPQSEDGSYEYPYFHLYWQEPTRFPFYIIAGDEIVGFVMVRQLGDGFHSIAEFYIRPAHRRNGNGRRTMDLVFGMFPGSYWLISVIRQNVNAVTFWLNVANTSGQPIELEIIDKQRFNWPEIWED